MFPNDHGPIYKETIAGRFPVEPWNTASNLVFLTVVIYWSIKVYPYFRDHKFLAFCLPVLLIGYIGGTVYHATRSHNIWLMMDWMPILLLCFAVVIYYFTKLNLPLIIPLLMISFPFILLFLLPRFVTLPRGMYPAIGYSSLAFIIVFPIVYYLAQTQWQHGISVLLSVLFFALAITFRSIDHSANIPFITMGTHWLWHFFGGVAVHFLIQFIFRDGTMKY